MRPWFWGWLIACVGIALASLLARDRASAPFAAGAAAATVLEAFRASPSAEWAAFLIVSAVLFVAVNRARYRGRHAHGSAARSDPEADAPPHRPKHARGRSGDTPTR